MYRLHLERRKKAFSVKVDYISFAKREKKGFLSRNVAIDGSTIAHSYRAGQTTATAALLPGGAAKDESRGQMFENSKSKNVDLFVIS